MKDRTPLNPGRVLITPENDTAPFYATLERADNATQDGDPLNKTTLLKDATAKLFALDNSAVPDDVLHLLGNYIPSRYGLLIIRSTDTSGNLLGAQISVSPSVDGKNTITIGDRGYFSALVTPGIYTISAGPVTIFENVEINTPSVEVISGEPVVASITIEKIEHGEVDITTNTEIRIPKWLSSIDLFGVGGGAGGEAAKQLSNYGASGGSGGYTETLLNLNLSGRTLSINIGAGGLGGEISDTGTDIYHAWGGNGGDTTISISGLAPILTAAGGKSGTGTDLNSADRKGGSGGGGGGGSDANNSNLNGGSDGSDGFGLNAGIGQGRTTRKFGESTGTLYSGGGAGVYVDKNSGQVSIGTPGAGGGGVAVGIFEPATGDHKGGDATTFGAGGGAANAYPKDIFWKYNSVTGGAGFQGLASIRW